MTPVRLELLPGGGRLRVIRRLGDPGRPIGVSRPTWLFLAALLALGGCAARSGSRRPQFAIVGKSRAQYWDQVRQGALREARSLGADVTVFLPPHEDPDAQASAVRNFVQMRVSGIAIAASNPDSISPEVTRALQAGIPVIALDTDAPDTGRLAYIGTDNTLAGQQAGSEMARLTGARGDVLVSTGSLTATNARERIEGFEAAISQYPDMEIVEVIVNHEDPFLARRQIEEALRQHPGVAGVFAVYGIDGPAAARAVVSLGRVGKTRLVCFDTTPANLSFLRQGVIQVLIGQRPYLMGARSVGLLARIAREGQAKVLASLGSRRVVDTGVDVVTRQNLEAYRKTLRELGIPHQAP